MKTYLVILQLGKVAASFALPTASLDECRDSIQDRPALNAVIAGVGLDTSAVTLDCVRARRAPLIGEER
jgi:hypothetical protein